MAIFQSSNGVIYPHWSNWIHAHSPLHWKAGRSAMLLAQAWGGSHGFPWRVKIALDKEKSLGDLTVDIGTVEYPTKLVGYGADSMTDLMILACQQKETVTLAVEGKVSEQFDLTVKEWLDAAPSDSSRRNRRNRLKHLLAPLNLSLSHSENLRYQLIHRAYSAYHYGIINQAKSTVFLVHSFLHAKHPENHWSDFQAFAQALGITRVVPDMPHRVSAINKINFWLCWVSDAGGVV